MIAIDQTRWYDRLLAAFIFFTRLPFWRMRQPPKQAYDSVVEYWPLTGWLTGGAMAATLYFGSMVMPLAVAVVLAVVVRMLITGALHEDGLADFFDGFGGGGTDRERILAIMKDSHIGTYGVLALIVYLLLLTVSLCAIADGETPPLPFPVDGRGMAALAILAATPFARMVTAQLVMMMPYARREDEAKARTVYRRPSTVAGISLAVQGLLPMAGFLWITGLRWDMVLFIPALVMYFLYLFIWRRLRGYTGDCCGAVCLLVELTVYLVVCAL
ncbi:MAG: adenosylcobinamide-GDP ribazoletransferase [Prevotella sp.]|nr:adenosylcobinamide-GDP ribazoletransferase [Prevotella sp.]